MTQNNKTTNNVVPPLGADKLKNIAQHEKNLRDWMNKTFKGVEGYEEGHVDRAFSLVKGAGYYTALTPGIAGAAGASIFSLLAILIQIGLTMADKDKKLKLVERFSQSSFKSVVDTCFEKGVEWNNFFFESTFNKLSEVSSGKSFAYIGEALSPSKITEIRANVAKVIREKELDSVDSEEKLMTRVEQQLNVRGD